MHFLRLGLECVCCRTNDRPSSLPKIEEKGSDGGKKKPESIANGSIKKAETTENEKISAKELYLSKTRYAPGIVGGSLCSPVFRHVTMKSFRCEYERTQKCERGERIL